MFDFFLVVFLVILLIRWMFKGFIRSLLKQAQAKNQQQTSQQSKSSKASKSEKVIRSDEGEYVDFEEIAFSSGDSAKT